MGAYADRACEFFLNEANCAQAVFAAFSDKIGMDEKICLKLSSSFGGGMGRLREVCGAVSGMFLVVGALYGYAENDDEKKKEHYALIQKLAAEFKDVHHTIICRELLNLEPTVPTPVPTKRDAKFYAERPCLRFVETAAEIIEKLITE